MSLKKVSLISLKQHYERVGGTLLAIAITACNTSPPSQSLTTKQSQEINHAIAFSPSATLSPTPGRDSLSPSQEAIQVIQDYYRAIARRDYEQAYLYWESDSASPQSFEQFKQGFANTASVAVDLGTPGHVEGAAGLSYIEIPVTITAVTMNGIPQRFRGSYVLRRVNNVPGSTAVQRRWHLYSGNITQVN